VGDAAQQQRQPVGRAGRKALDQGAGVRVELATPTGGQVLQRDRPGRTGWAGRPSPS
jgi:hypothetical protein